MYVNLQDINTHAIDGFGVYFGDDAVDTIKYHARIPLTFLTPQISNPNGNIINDTVNWIPVTGTFVATGGEKFAVVGNFKSDAATSTISTGQQAPPGVEYSEYFVDQIYCFELDPHFAGRDTTLLPGDSLFIGKTNDDDWIDTKFTWYQPPGSAAITTVTGLWVKPVVTSTYVVKQEICSYTIWDTIVVRIKEDDTRIASLRAAHFKVYPLPATAWVEVDTDVPEWFKGYDRLSIVNPAGQVLAEHFTNFTAKNQRLDISRLPEGVYFLRLSGSGGPPVSKRFIIMR